MAAAWKHALDGQLAGLSGAERRSLFAYAYRNTAASRTALTFGLPLLFVIGWTRDYAVSPALAMDSLPRRLLLFWLLVAMALVMRSRLGAVWRETALVAYACVFSAGIAMTTLAEPERMSLTHVGGADHDHHPALRPAPGDRGGSGGRVLAAAVRHAAGAGC